MRSRRLNQQQGTKAMTRNNGSEFDFLTGRWSVRHRRLVTRLAGADDWQEFNGTATAMPVLGGLGNVDDNWLDLPGDAYRALSIRAFDPANGLWSIWWLDGRNPHALDVPVTGSFSDGAGTFLASDIFENRPISVRFRWTDIATGMPKWEQAFSQDGGLTYETNWTMWFSRS